MAHSGGAEAPKMIQKKMVVEYPAGSTLSPSRKTPGASSPLVHGPDGVSSQVVLYEIPSKKKSPGGNNFVADIVTQLAITAATVGIQMFIDKGVPNIKQRIAEKRAQKRATKPGESIAISTTAAAMGLHDSDCTEVVEPTDPMSSEQWYRLFFDALAHGAASSAHQRISAEKWQELASARVEDDEETQSLARGMRELPPEEVSERVDLVLERYPELRDQDPAVVLRRLFGDSPDPEATRMPADGDSGSGPGTAALPRL